MFDSIKFCQRRIEEYEVKLALAEAEHDSATVEQLRADIENYTKLLKFYNNKK